jgi:hypothetical protein
LAFHVVLHVGSRKIYGVSASHFRHILIFYPFLMVSGVGSSNEKGKPLENDVGEKYKKFSRGNIFLYIYKQDEIDFI